MSSKSQSHYSLIECDTVYLFASLVLETIGGSARIYWTLKAHIVSHCYSSSINLLPWRREDAEIYFTFQKLRSKKNIIILNFQHSPSLFIFFLFSFYGISSSKVLLIAYAWKATNLAVIKIWSQRCTCTR